LKVSVDVIEAMLPGDYCDIEGVCVTCSRCGHETESYGTSDSSVRRCMVLLREECPMGESNFYAADGEMD
jgi:hypothetical protein